MSIKYWAAATVVRYKNWEREILILWLSHWFHDVWQLRTNRGTRNQLGPHFPSFPADLIKTLGRVTTDSRRQIARLITGRPSAWRIKRTPHLSLLVMRLHDASNHCSYYAKNAELLVDEQWKGFDRICKAFSRQDLRSDNYHAKDFYLACSC